MKHTLVYMALASTIGCFTACNIIDADNRYIEVENNNEPQERVQRVLVEEFTGRTCVNCPEGAAVIHDMIEYYGEQVVTIGYHAGDMAPAAVGPFAGQDFQTEAGDTYEDYFSPQAYPAAMVNRTANDGVMASTKKELWMTYVIAELAKTPVCEVTPTCVYDTATRTATITTEVEAWDNMPEGVNLQVQLVESGIVGAQLTPTGMLNDYEHNHVFRGTATEIWGDPIASLPAGEKQSYTHTITLDETWVAENCNIVVFAYIKDTQRVLQCNECHVIATTENE